MASRKQLAKETICYIKQGWYPLEQTKIQIADLQQYAQQHTVLISPQQSEQWITATKPKTERKADIQIENISTVQAICNWKQQGIEQVGVLNFASAKNPGGGFLNGANAQEESLAVSSGLYHCLLEQPEYYETNRVCNTMMYTDYAIFSPEVVFFRDGKKMNLLPKPVTASVLTMPAVNMRQVIRKGEDQQQARQVMKNRMRKVLAIFLEKGCKNLILGAYGCGVFQNDVTEVAQNWSDLLETESYNSCFEHVLFAILDHSKEEKSIQIFKQIVAVESEKN